MLPLSQKATATCAPHCVGTNSLLYFHTSFSILRTHYGYRLYSVFHFQTTNWRSAHSIQLMDYIYISDLWIYHISYFIQYVPLTSTSRTETSWERRMTSLLTVVFSAPNTIWTVSPSETDRCMTQHAHPGWLSNLFQVGFQKLRTPAWRTGEETPGRQECKSQVTSWSRSHFPKAFLQGTYNQVQLERGGLQQCPGPGNQPPMCSLVSS